MHLQRRCSRQFAAFTLHLEGGVDAADQRVQDVNILMLVDEDEGEEGLQQGRLRNAPQEEVEVRSGGHHLL